MIQQTYGSRSLLNPLEIRSIFTSGVIYQGGNVIQGISREAYDYRFLLWGSRSLRILPLLHRQAYLSCVRGYYPLTINSNVRSNTVDAIAYISSRAFLSIGLFYSGMSSNICMGGRLTAGIALLFLSSR